MSYILDSLKQIEHNKQANASLKMDTSQASVWHDNVKHANLNAKRLRVKRFRWLLFSFILLSLCLTLLYLGHYSNKLSKGSVYGALPDNLDLTAIQNHSLAPVKAVHSNINITPASQQSIVKQAQVAQAQISQTPLTQVAKQSIDLDNESSQIISSSVIDYESQSYLPDLRIQMLAFHPDQLQRSVVVNGSRLYLGDKVEGFTISSIEPKSIRLVQSKQGVLHQYSLKY